MVLCCAVLCCTCVGAGAETWDEPSTTRQKVRGTWEGMSPVGGASSTAGQLRQCRCRRRSLTDSPGPQCRRLAGKHDDLYGGLGFLNEHDVGLVLDLGLGLGPGRWNGRLGIKVGWAQDEHVNTCWLVLLLLAGLFVSLRFTPALCVWGIRHCLTAHLGSPGQ